MAQEIIDLSSPNDGQGDSLRNGGVDINDNFTELYSVDGWGFYVDSLTTPTITFGTTEVKLTIDGTGSTSESAYLPREIRGSSELWNVANNELVPIKLGDSYDLRIDLEVTAKSGNPDFGTFILDIGGAATPTIEIVRRRFEATSTPPYNISFAFPIFCLTTFLTNNAQIFINVDSGSIDVGDRSIFIRRTFRGDT